jgi:hypothetical protein
LVRSLIVQPISHYRRNHNNNWDELGSVNEATKIVTALLILDLWKQTCNTDWEMGEEEEQENRRNCSGSIVGGGI